MASIFSYCDSKTTGHVGATALKPLEKMTKFDGLTSAVPVWIPSYISIEPLMPPRVPCSDRLVWLPGNPAQRTACGPKSQVFSPRRSHDPQTRSNITDLSTAGAIRRNPRERPCKEPTTWRARCPMILMFNQLEFNESFPSPHQPWLQYGSAKRTWRRGGEWEPNSGKLGSWSEYMF